ncbi:MAG: Maf family protein [Alphaproteobacteria bacterium]|nr:Maf family protein [Alphaproteobacteria bacterium]
MTDITTKDFILASSSPQRKRLLEQIGFIPKEIISADIDESERLH